MAVAYFTLAIADIWVWAIVIVVLDQGVFEVAAFLTGFLIFLIFIAGVIGCCDEFKAAKEKERRRRE